MPYRIELRTGLDGIEPEDWDALVGDDDPFVEHAFLHALERSQSVCADAGWVPLHVTVYEDETLIGALPLYAKDNSWGEYIFDFAWARAANQFGLDYYPKLVSMAPFTPATGRRLLAKEGADLDLVTTALLAGAQAAADEVNASSIHLLFLSDEERARVVDKGMLARLSVQFHWENEGYETFDDYLAGFRSSKRKQVRKERRSVEESGLRIETKLGTELSDAEWKALDRFYRDNCRRYGFYLYLTRGFFRCIRETNAERLVSVIAYQDDRPVAASINFEKGSRLYGRYWGCAESHEFLHFELCYYRLIERAIERKIQHFEAGAQGFHKLKRGLRPTGIHSAHWIRDPGLGQAIGRFLPSEADEVRMEIAMLEARGPFHRG